MATEAVFGDIPIPTFGSPIPVGEALPSPVGDAVEGMTTIGDQHIALFSSIDPGLGDDVKTLGVQLHTKVYLDKGFISERDLNPLGLFVDEYTPRSTYVYALNGTKVATARQVSCEKEGLLSRLGLMPPKSDTGILSLPTARNFEIDPHALCEVAGARSPADLKPSEVVEISGLASRKKEEGELGKRDGGLDAVLALYSKMLANSLEQGHKVWLQNVDRPFVRLLANLVGDAQIRILGPEREYVGPPTVPVAFNILDATRYIMSSHTPTSNKLRAHFREVFSGMSDRKLPIDIREMIEREGIQLNHHSDIKRGLANPKFLAKAAIVGYSAARALPAAQVEQFHGNIALLWGIDVATAYPYAWGLIEGFTGETIPRRIGGAAVAAACFVAPYAYFYAEGKDYPTAVNYVAGSLIGAAVAKEIVGRRIKGRRNAHLNAGLRSTKPNLNLPSPRQPVVV